MNPETDLPVDGQSIFLVFGCHRSGTSAVTRLLNLLGGELPKSLMPAKDDNPAGFWESTELTSLHEEILQSYGSSWGGIDPLPAFSFQTEPERKLVARLEECFVSEFGDSSAAVVKDPRACRLVPFWRELASRRGARLRPILVFRNPLEVASSLKRRNDIALPRSLLLWLRHALESEANTQDLPRLFINFDGLTSNWRRVADELSERFQHSWIRTAARDAEIETFLSERRRNERHSDAEVEAASDPMLDWVRRTYRQLKLLQRDPESSEAQKVLAEVRGELSQADNLIAPVIADVEHRLRLALAGRSHAREEFTSLQDLMQKEREKGQSEKRHLSEAANEKKAKLEEQIDRLNLEVKSQVDKVRILQQELERVAHKEAEALDLAEQLQQTTDRNGRLSRRLEDVLEEVRELKECFAREQQEREAEKRYSASRDIEIEQLQRTLSLAQTATDNERNSYKAALIAEKAQRELVEAKNEALELVKAPWLARWLPSVPRHRRPTAQQSAPASLIAGATLKNRSLMTLLGSGLRKDLPWRAISTIKRLSLAPEMIAKYLKIASSPLFSAAFYLATYEDVRSAGLDPVLHYLEHGGCEGRQPSPWFDGKSYLRANPDVAAKKYNPLLHYIDHGAKEGRRLGVPEHRNSTGPDTHEVTHSGSKLKSLIIQYTPENPRNPYYTMIPKALAKRTTVVLSIDRDRISQALRSHRCLVSLHQLEPHYHQADLDSTHESARALLAQLRDWKARGARLCLTWHNPFPHDRRFIAEDLRFYRELGGLLSAVVIHTRAARPFVESFVPARRIHYLPHPSFETELPIIDRSQARRALEIADGDFLIGSFGQIKMYKRVELLLEAWQRAGCELQHARLVIIGQPASQSYLAELEALGGADVRWIAADMSHDDLVRWVMAMDLGVFTHRDIWTSGAAILAKTCGTPVIMPENKHTREYIRHEDNGFLFEPGSADSLADTLLSASCSPLLPHIRSMNRAWSVSHSAVQIADRYREVFEGCLS